MVETDKNERKHSRINFPATATLRFSDNVEEIPLLDISLKGALVHKPKAWLAALHDTCVLHLTLSQDVEIQMSMSVAHITGNHLGLNCDYIDVESISHLKRLVALNAADNTLLERELIELTAHSKQKA